MCMCVCLFYVSSLCAPKIQKGPSNTVSAQDFDGENKYVTNNGGLSRLIQAATEVLNYRELRIKFIWMVRGYC